MRFLINFAQEDSGSNALEYGLIVALVSLAIVTGAGAAGTALGDMFTKLGTAVAGVVFPAAA